MIQKDFEQNIVDLQSTLLRFAQCLTHNDDDARDLLQETDLKALSHPDQYRKGNLKSWLYTIMHHLFLNDRRHAAHHNTYIADFHIDRKAKTCAPADDHFSANDIIRVIELLPPDSRTLFTLYLQGYSYNEIAKQLDLPIGTIKTRIFRIKRELQARRKELL